MMWDREEGIRAFTWIWLAARHASQSAMQPDRFEKKTCVSI